MSLGYTPPRQAAPFREETHAPLHTPSCRARCDGPRPARQRSQDRLRRHHGRAERVAARRLTRHRLGPRELRRRGTDHARQCHFRGSHRQHDGRTHPLLHGRGRHRDCGRGHPAGHVPWLARRGDVGQLRAHVRHECSRELHGWLPGGQWRHAGRCIRGTARGTRVRSRLFQRAHDVRAGRRDPRLPRACPRAWLIAWRRSMRRRRAGCGRRAVRSPPDQGLTERSPRASWSW